MKMVLLWAMPLKRGSGYRNEFHCIEPELNISHLRFRITIHKRTRYEKTCFLRKAVSTEQSTGEVGKKTHGVRVGWGKRRLYNILRYGCDLGQNTSHLRCQRSLWVWRGRKQNKHDTGIADWTGCPASHSQYACTAPSWMGHCDQMVLGASS
jgi:hypothetical protein